MKRKTGIIGMVIFLSITGIALLCGQNKNYGLAFKVDKATSEEIEEYPMEEDYSLEATSPKYNAHVENYYNNTVQITSLETQKSTTLKVEDELKLGNCIDEVLWINDTTLAVIMHANPSLSVLFVIDADKNEILYTKYGSAFTWLDENPESLLYVEEAPHFAKENGYEEIKNYEEDSLLKTKEDEEILGFDISEEDNTIAYVVNDKKDNETVYFADYQEKKKELKQTKKVKLKTKKKWFRWGKDGDFYAESEDDTVKIKYDE